MRFTSQPVDDGDRFELNEEADLKYFVLGAFSSAFLLFGLQQKKNLKPVMHFYIT